jgi:Flp pilus assembly protein TadG
MSNRRIGQRGNTMVEVALTFLPMLVMFIGVMDVSLAIFVQSTLTNATREGARFAVTYQSTYGASSCTNSQASCIAQVVQSNAIGFLNGSKANLITVNYYTANDLTNPSMVCNAGACTQKGALPQTLSNGKVVNFPNQPGNIVEVTVTNFPWNWILPISATTGQYTMTTPSVALGGSSMDVLGALAVGTIVPPNP